MITVYFDGACEPVNPGGTAAYGVAIYNDFQRIWECSRLFVPKKGRERETSNNVAEYSGFLDALRWLLAESLHEEPIMFKGDSKLVIEQMFGTWQMRQGFYIPIAKKAKKLLKKFPKATGAWIPREENSIADELSKAELIASGVKFRIQPHD